MATYSKGSLRERSKGHWQARFCRTDRNGSSIVTRSFEATSRRAATLIMEDVRRELIEQDGDGASSRELIAYMLDYVDERERSQQIEASTATNYRSSIKHLARYLEGYSIEEITPENVMDVQAALLADGLVADTVAKDHRFFKVHRRRSDDGEQREECEPRKDGTARGHARLGVEAPRPVEVAGESVAIDGP